MGFVPFVNVCKLEAVFDWNGQIVENVHYYRQTQAWIVEDMTQLAQAFVTSWNSNLKTIVSDQCSLTAVKVTDMSAENAPGIEFTGGLPIRGTNTSPSLPNNVTVAIKWITLKRGRSYRGRTYHVGLMENQVDGNEVNASTLGLLRDAYAPLIYLTNGLITAYKVVASRISLGEERITGVATDVTAVAIDPTVDSQRRRLPGRGK